jgi:hypothetical protein
MTSEYAYARVLSKDLSENEDKYNIKAIPGDKRLFFIRSKEKGFPPGRKTLRFSFLFLGFGWRSGVSFAGFRSSGLSLAGLPEKVWRPLARSFELQRGGA